MTGTAPQQPGSYSLRPATKSDAPSVAALVHAAYGHYVERIGMLPRPMTDDYTAVIRNRQVTVAEYDGAIVGVVVLSVTDEGFLVDNVAVHPSRRGTGLGRALLQFAEAEARHAGFDAHPPVHPRADDGEPRALLPDRLCGVRPALPGRVLAGLSAQAAWMRAALMEWVRGTLVH